MMDIYVPRRVQAAYRLADKIRFSKIQDTMIDKV